MYTRKFINQCIKVYRIICCISLVNFVYQYLMSYHKIYMRNLICKSPSFPNSKKFPSLVIAQCLVMKILSPISVPVNKQRKNAREIKSGVCFRVLVFVSHNALLYQIGNFHRQPRTKLKKKQWWLSCLLHSVLTAIKKQTNYEIQTV